MIKTTIGVDGMACSMCESHINDTIRKNFDVKSVKASRSKKNAIVISETELDPKAVEDAIEATGYHFTSISSEPYTKKGLFSH